MKKKILIIIAIIMILSTLIRTVIISAAFLNFSDEIILNQSALIEEILNEVTDTKRFIKVMKKSKDIKCIEIENNDKNINSTNIHYDFNKQEITVIIPFNDSKVLKIVYAGDIYFNKIFKAILQLILIAIISLIIIILIVNYYLTPYLEILEKVKDSTNKMLRGNFDIKIDTKLKGEAKEFVDDFNNFIEKMKNSFGVIEEKYTYLIEKEKSNDPLNDAKETIEQLANIFAYKKLIEDDLNTNEILNRLIEVIDSYNIENYAIITIDNRENNASVFYTKGDVCCEITDNYKDCRAYRLNKEINSFTTPHICTMHYCNNNYICLVFSSGGNFTGILKIMDNNYEKLKHILPYIKSYLNETSNVIEAKYTLELLHKQTIIDPLTGLFNRRYLENIINTIIAAAMRRNEKIGFLMVDMDYFKKVNDTYGHDAGDKVLQTLANILKNSVRKSDIVIRYGGEEFLIILQNLKNEEEGLLVAEKIRKNVERTKINLGNETISKTISIGISVYPNHCEKAWECIKAADNALYEAKKTGRNKAVLYKENMKI